jgi:DNA-binding beta-propeller fold protein YncE
MARAILLQGRAVLDCVHRFAGLLLVASIASCNDLWGIHDLAPRADVDGGDAARCGSGTTLCSGECVATDYDPRHCGMCDRACAAPKVCLQAECVCAAGSIACGDLCIEPLTDPRFCGATEGCHAGTPSAGIACPAGQFCSGGACVFTSACTVLDSWVPSRAPNGITVSRNNEQIFVSAGTDVLWYSTSRFPYGSRTDFTAAAGLYYDPFLFNLFVADPGAHLIRKFVLPAMVNGPWGVVASISADVPDLRFVTGAGDGTGWVYAANEAGTVVKFDGRPGGDQFITPARVTLPPIDPTMCFPATLELRGMVVHEDKLYVSLRDCVVGYTVGEDAGTLGPLGVWLLAPDPRQIAVDAAGHVYVTRGQPAPGFEIHDETLSGTIAKCPVGDPDGGIADPDGIDVDLDGNVYVIDRAGPGRVYKFASHFTRLP